MIPENLAWEELQFMNHDSLQSDQITQLIKNHEKHASFQKFVQPIKNHAAYQKIMQPIECLKL